MQEYSIMSLNMMTDHLYPFASFKFPHRAMAINALIKETKPDLIGVQELTRTMFPYMQDIFQEYGIFGDSRHSFFNDEYSSILYRKDRFNLIGGETKWLSHAPSLTGTKVLGSMYPRIVTIGYFCDRTNNDLFTFANTHLDSNFPNVRNEQAGIMASLLNESQKGNFMFVTGDFNTTQESDALHLFQKTHLQNAVTMKMGSTLRGSIGSRAHNNHPIDHIYYSSNLVLMNVKKVTTPFDGVYPSDHYPVLAYFVR